MPTPHEQPSERNSPLQVYRFGLLGFIWAITFYAGLFALLRIALSAETMLGETMAYSLAGTALGFPGGFLLGGFVKSVIWSIIGGLVGFNLGIVASSM